MSEKTSDRTEREAVVLVHGLWMGGWACQPLKFYLRRAGFAVRVFAYPSFSGSLTASADSLAGFVATLGEGPVSFVGHSLGGLVILKYVWDRRPRQLKRVVLLGSPYAGCYAAERLASRAWGRAILGRCMPEWSSVRPPYWASPQQLGVIAGLRRFGLGRLVIPDVPQPSDGVVSLAETEIPGASERLVMKVSHSGMLVSRRVALAVVEFLRNGRFPRDLHQEF